MRLFLSALLLVLNAHAYAETKVLTTIKPLQLIAAAITDGVSTTEVLLPVGASHHDYALKPSDVTKLKQADVIFWIGPTLETFLVKPLADEQYANKAKAFIDSKDLHLKKYKDHNHDEDDDHKGEPAVAIDPHIWLLPSNATVIAKTMADKLSAIDAVNKSRYQQNYQQFVITLDQTDKQAAAKLATVKDRGYVVLHDGYGYFEDHYGLHHQGELMLNPERAPGAKHLSEVEALIKSGGVVCVFGEPQFQLRYLDGLIERLDVRRGTVDYLASDVVVSKDGYPQFLEKLAEQFYSCLKI